MSSTWRRIASPGSLALDPGRPDDRPPFPDLGSLIGAQRFRSLLLNGGNLQRQIGEPLAHGGIGQCLACRGRESRDNIRSGTLQCPEALPNGHIEAGLRVLAYLALADDVRSKEERNIETSFIEARLAMCGFDRDPEMISALVDVARALAVTPRSYAMAVNAVAGLSRYGDRRTDHLGAHRLADVDDVRTCLLRD